MSDLSPAEKMDALVKSMFQHGHDYEDVMFEFDGIQITLDDLENYTRVYNMVQAANRRARNKLREHGLLPTTS